MAPGSFGMGLAVFRSDDMFGLPICITLKIEKTRRGFRLCLRVYLAEIGAEAIS